MIVISKFKVYRSKLTEVIYRSSFQNCISRNSLLKKRSKSKTFISVRNLIRFELLPLFIQNSEFFQDQNIYIR